MSAVKNGALARFSRIALGTWRVLEWKMRPTELAAYLQSCQELGISTLDSADIYSDYLCESVLGEALAHAPQLRHSLQFVSKCGIRLTSPRHPDVRVKHYDTSRAYIQAQVDGSLRALGIERLDLLLIHRPDPLMDADEVAEAFCALKQSGKVLAFGVSNFAPRQLELLQSRLPFALVANQIECSLLKSDPLFDGSLDQCQRMRMMPMAWSPLGGGRLPATGGALGDALLRIGRELGLSSEQLALAWLLRHPAGIVPVVGTGRLDRIEAAAQVMKVELDRQAWFSLLEAAQGHPVP
ncbi:aldo/keto reductase [Niveibacterium terrae]|uniref:aldo/keto reductase n=1 Tax=Niveibacterium terrae TaxID=3373598 RepID=UPI003A94E8DC